MAKLVLDDIGSTLTNTAATTINNNNAKIEVALENTLSRDGTVPNNMAADIDMNSNDLLNVGTTDTDRLILNGSAVQAVDLAGALKISNALSELAPLGLDDDARSNLGLGNSATRNVGTTAGTVAAGDDSRITNSVQRNADLGIDTNNTVASRPIPPGAFGGLFLTSAFASSVWTYLKNAVDATAGPRFLMSLATRVLGGHANGPDQQRSVLWLLAEKLNWNLNTALSGEIDGAYIQVRQGNLDDAGGILIDGAKVFDAGATGGLTDIEGSATRQNWAGTVLNKVRFICGFQEGAGGALNGAGASFYAEAETGATSLGMAIVNNTSTFLHAVAGFLSRSPAARWFSIRWDGDPLFELGSPADAMKLRYNASAIKVQDETGALNHYVMAKDGIFRARVGVAVADNQATLKRVLTASQSVDFANITAQNAVSATVTVTGALVGDTVIVSPSTDYASDKIIFTGRVTSTNTVTIHAQNFGTAAIDPAAQTLRVTVLGF